MRTVSTAEAYGAIFNFEPPVPIRDNEPTPLSLERLATVAWYGTEFPRSMADQLCEERFLGAFDSVNRDPELIAQKLSEVLTGKHLITLEV